jgi:hypothetical protein
MPTPSAKWRPVTPHARLQSPRPLLPASSVFPSFYFFTRAAAAAVPPPPPCAITGHGRSGHASSPRAAPSCPKLLLPLAQPALTSIARGKLPILVNRSPEIRPSSPRIPAPWKPPLCSRFSFTRARIPFTPLSRCSDAVFPRRPMAGGALPPLSCAAEPPWPWASSVASSSGHAVCTNVTALARWSRWW